ncbi:MAG TPA: bifunctional pyr operon transcriptional regulator/uracil phosphoribosyltransferase PyrR [Opitutaceae bacterium]
MAETQTLNAADIHAAIDRLAGAIALAHRDKTERLLLLGIANGGIELTRRIAARLPPATPGLRLVTGTLDISFHRDDIGRNPIPKEFAPTLIPVDVTGATVVLVDDVLFTGRTVKAALDELFDHGRPAKVELAILIDRGGRLLPFAPDYTGATLAAGEDEKVVVRLAPSDPSRDEVQVVRKSKI